MEFPFSQGYEIFNVVLPHQLVDVMGKHIRLARIF